MKTTSFEGVERLSENEKALFEIFVALQRESIWLPGIKNVVSKGNPEIFRQLVCDLKSQANDNPVVMERILGKEGFEQLALV